MSEVTSVKVDNTSMIDANSISKENEVAKKMWINFEADYKTRIHDLIDKKDA
ncbi:hypothetical protein RA086_03200 [Lactiplantibacillus sp. WILCCON 0030]|uniref:Prophage protein n=1 Tax=Lactiplantibacillus brownii TaxID=3069269 RepID=A0ABU1A6U5_9LACO|nr:hypothetical protein [Lactiplantibacillus brownii]MDQ7936653.1 hypothetical protein [Lactiplantibacillus brownii]